MISLVQLKKHKGSVLDFLLESAFQKSQNNTIINEQQYTNKNPPPADKIRSFASKYKIEGAEFSGTASEAAAALLKAMKGIGTASREMKPIFNTMRDNPQWGKHVQWWFDNVLDNEGASLEQWIKGELAWYEFDWGLLYYSESQALKVLKIADLAQWNVGLEIGDVEQEVDPDQANYDAIINIVSKEAIDSIQAAKFAAGDSSMVTEADIQNWIQNNVTEDDLEIISASSEEAAIAALQEQLADWTWTKTAIVGVCVAAASALLGWVMRKIKWLQPIANWFLGRFKKNPAAGGAAAESGFLSRLATRGALKLLEWNHTWIIRFCGTETRKKFLEKVLINTCDRVIQHPKATIAAKELAQITKSRIPAAMAGTRSEEAAAVIAAIEANLVGAVGREVTAGFVNLRNAYSRTIAGRSERALFQQSITQSLNDLLKPTGELEPTLTAVFTRKWAAEVLLSNQGVMSGVARPSQMRTKILNDIYGEPIVPRQPAGFKIGN